MRGPVIIEPFLTLNHWDLPQRLQERGGWASRETVDAFARFTDAVSRRLGDRVRSWVTHNEPWCMAHLGYEQGVHAPGLRDPGASLRVAHHLLLSHGRAVEIVSVDDESDPAKAPENTNKLVKRDGVDVLVGSVHSGVALAMAKHGGRNQVVAA